MCIGPLNSVNHPDGIGYIVTGRIAPDAVNVDNSVAMGKEQMKQFETGWPKTFYEPLSNKVVTMSVTKKRIKLGSADCFDTNLIYSRVMGLMSSRDVDLKDVFFHELALVPTSMFEDSGDMRITKSKSTLKRKLQVEQSSRTLPIPETIVVDGCAILWTIQLPKHGTVQDYVNNVLEYIFGKLQHSDVNVIFDRYYEYSINSSTRTSRTVQQASRRHRLTPSTPLPAQTVVLTITENKQQIIDTICEQLREKGKTHETEMKHILLVIGPASIPVEIFKGVAIERRDLEMTHEEADVIIPRASCGCCHTRLNVCKNNLR